MTLQGWLQIAVFFGLILACVKPLGSYIAAVVDGKPTFLSRIFRPIERLTYRCCGIDETREQNWLSYAGALLAFSLVSAVLLYAFERLQQFLPWNPQGFGPMSPDLSFNTAMSFDTNTNWQSYTPESTMGYFIQMAGLTVHNFMSAAAGLGIAMALVRGFARHSVKTIGNFWVDLTRSVLYVLMPISIIAALLLVWQGSIQNLHGYTAVTTLEGVKQVIAQGPVASQEAIKMLGTNGGGFFNANSAHPFENPSPLSNLLQMFLIFLIPGALTYTFGKMVRDTRQGWALFAAMSILWFAGVLTAYHFEQKEVKMAMLALLVLAASILLFSGASSVVQFAKNSYWNPPGPATANLNNPGAHGFSEILYAYTSGTGNNGSAFAGINANTPWYNLTIGLAMLIGRFLMIIPLLAAAGSLAAKKQVPVSAGTFPTHGPLFVGLLVGVVLIVGALTFFPALALGPIVEHLML